jgi:surface antigen
MWRMKSISSASVCALLLAGCANYQSQQEQSGMVRGDGRTAAIVLGTLAGAAIGGSIGHSMAETDKLKTAHALENVRTGVPTSWKNPDSGNEYVVVPTRTYEAPSGPCREYTIDAVVAGKKDKVFGTACRQPDGSWQVRN